MAEFITIPGQCYANALRFAMLHEEETMQIVHGKVEGGGDLNGFPIIHAWIELDEWVYDYDFSVKDVVRVPTDIYYAMGNIKHDEVEKYSLSKAASLALKSNHCGPWNEDFALHSLYEEQSLWNVPPPKEL